jgi:F-type H+-transporting ATPase subunit b
MAEMKTGTEVPAGEHGAKGGFPPFDSSTFASQILWLVLAFALLYYLMSKIALPRVAGILENRANRISTDLEAAQALKTQSDTAMASYEAALAEARGKAQTIAGETRAAVDAEAETTRKSLEAELGNKLAAAESQISATKATALGNVRSIAVEATSAIVERLIGRAPDSQTVTAAVDAAVAQ